MVERFLAGLDVHLAEIVEEKRGNEVRTADNHPFRVRGQRGLHFPGRRRVLLVQFVVLLMGETEKPTGQTEKKRRGA